MLRSALGRCLGRCSSACPLQPHSPQLRLGRPEVAVVSPQLGHASVRQPDDHVSGRESARESARPFGEACFLASAADRDAIAQERAACDLQGGVQEAHMGT